MDVTKVEETVNCQNAENYTLRPDLLEILTVVLLVNGSVYVLMGKVFQNKR